MHMQIGTQSDVVGLVQAARDGSQLAYDELYRRYQWLVWKQIRRWVHDPGTAADLVQEVFILAFAKLAQLREPRHFAAWLRRIAHNRVFVRLRRAREPVRFRSYLPDIVDPSPSPALRLELLEERLMLRTGIAHLSIMDQQALQAFHYDGLSLKQIAARFARPVGTIKRRL